MTTAGGPYLQYRIRALENEAREREVHANALEADALAERQGAQRCRKTAEYLKSYAVPAGRMTDAKQ